MDSILLTIMTPTYNRAKLLKRLYDSLCVQNSSNFEWLIIDDGSNDNTKLIVDNMISEHKISIRYIYQENGGKCKAFDRGVSEAKGKLFFCVDSDDILAMNAIIHIEKIWSEIEFLNNIAGIVALKKDTDGNLLSDTFPDNLSISRMYDLEKLYNIKGEFAILHKTDVLKKYRFPMIEGEKFMGECVLYDKIDMIYKMYLSNYTLNICEYQSDGYSNSFFKNMMENPIGYKIYYNQRIDMTETFKERILYTIKYIAFSRMAVDDEYNYNGKYKYLIKLLYPFGLAAHLYYYIKNKRV